MASRVLIGEDDVLLREGIAGILERAGLEVVAQVGDAADFLRRAQAYRPDVVVTDIQMPPGNADDGLRAALELRATMPEIGVVVLSQFFEESYAVSLIGERPEGVGYLLKERVGDVSVFVDAVSRVAAGGTALDPEIVARMMGRRRAGGPMDKLSRVSVRCWGKWPRVSRIAASPRRSSCLRRPWKSMWPQFSQARDRADSDWPPSRKRCRALPPRVRAVASRITARASRGLVIAS